MAETATAQQPETPFWWLDAPLDNATPLPVDAKCDVVVVGGGYTGLAAALVLARAGRSVQVFDRQRLGEGASTRNGGITSGNIRMALSRAIETMGERRAVAMYREGIRAREDLWRFIREEKIDCDFELAGRFTGATSREKYESQARETDLLNKHLDIGAEMVPRERQHDEVGSDMYYGGMRRPDIGHLQPAKLHAGILAKAREAGAVVHGETGVLGVERLTDGFEVRTRRGAVRCQHVIMATNGYTDGVSQWLRQRLVPVKSRIVVTEQLSPNLMKHLMPKGRATGETRLLYRYYRPSPDGRRIVIGGRETMRPNSREGHIEHIRRGLVEIFPDLRDVKIEHSWNGYVAFSRDELPGLFEHDGVIHACGYCGSGVVWARWMGERAAYRVLGDRDKADTMFEGPPPPSLPLYWGNPWFMPAAIGWYGLKDRWDQRKN